MPKCSKAISKRNDNYLIGFRKVFPLKNKIRVNLYGNLMSLILIF